NLQQAVENLGFVPNEAVRAGGSTLITSFFLHGGILHLVSNLYFLVIFGAAVEEALGKWLWLMLVMLAALIGDVAHFLSDPASNVPCIGASGGISGLIAFYALRFPKARLNFMYWFRWFQLPAWAAFVFWVMLQSLQGLISLGGGRSRVANFAHLGGALAGVLFWFRWKKQAAASRPVSIA